MSAEKEELRIEKRKLRERAEKDRQELEARLTEKVSHDGVWGRPLAPDCTHIFRNLSNCLAHLCSPYFVP